MKLKIKWNTLKEQREAAELELIIEEFGRAMRSAYKSYIAEHSGFFSGPGFTPLMNIVWTKYVDFCQRHSE